MSPQHERDVRLLVDLVLEHVDRELAVLGRQLRRRDALDQRLGPHPVLDQIRDRDHQQAVLLRELRQLRHARHRAVLVHDFADDAGRIQPGDARQIDGRFGLPGAHQHAARARAQRKHVAGPREVGRPRSPDRSPRARSPRDRRPRCRCVVRPFASIDTQNAVSNRERVLRHHQRNLELVEPLRRHRQADQAAAVPRHEVDRLRRHLLRRDRQVALVLAILIVDDDDHLAGADRLDRVLDAGERRRFRLAPWRSSRLFFIARARIFLWTVDRH